MNIPFPSQVTQNEALFDWVAGKVALCQPDSVHWCDGSDAEYQMLAQRMVESGTIEPLNPELRPNSFLAHSDPRDVARVEEQTFICSKRPVDAGPTNNWRDPKTTKSHLLGLFDGCMKGRTMYVVPFCLGPLDSRIARIGVEVTDSPYVALSMRLTTRCGHDVLRPLGQSENFVRCVHSLGLPLEEGQADVSWPCNPEERIIAHFPDTRQIWSFGSGYGGNALLAKKCFALRVASVMARDEGWMAEHMLILGITNPQGKKKYFAAAFPSACGKTNLAMMTPNLPGWKVECVGDDIAWLRVKADGRLYAVNPEFGFFGVAPGTSSQTNPAAIGTLKRDVVFTNVARTPEGDVWWEGLTDKKPPHLTDWRGQDWTPEGGTPAAHPNARFTARASQCPVIDPAYDDPRGVPISAILFGGRRPSTIPLVYQARSWAHGTFIGSTIASETTAAASGQVGQIRRDPMAMLPFCGYHMGDYFAHWLDIPESTTPDKMPRLFGVNWFRRAADGSFLWPGFGDNARVLKWIFERTDGQADALETPIGWVPTELDLSKLNVSDEDMDQLMTVDTEEWRREAASIREFYTRFGEHLPAELRAELDELDRRLAAS
ncbi:phosphoenolpyruvate carboxykinase [GTP] [Abditibacteriota bacterium]|nr:phosphoenolpyruvate carboxykinase [GTP] [Abditibacteriota bacterium]